MEIINKDVQVEYLNQTTHTVSYYGIIASLIITAIILICVATRMFMVHRRRKQLNQKSTKNESITLNNQYEDDRVNDNHKGFYYDYLVLESAWIIGLNVLAIVAFLTLHFTSGNEKVEKVKLEMKDGDVVIESFHDNKNETYNKPLYAKVKLKNGEHVNIALSEKDIHNGNLNRGDKAKIVSSDKYQLTNEETQTFMGEKDEYNDSKNEVYNLSKNSKLIRK